jgi:hypothetical protein
MTSLWRWQHDKPPDYSAIRRAPRYAAFVAGAEALGSFLGA